MKQMWDEKEIIKVAKNNFNLLDYGFVGTEDPSSEIGVDGNLYIQMVEGHNYLWIKIRGSWLKLA